MAPASIPIIDNDPSADAGKTRSSRNALKHGLFAAHDFIRVEETGEYAQTLSSLMEQLLPEGVLEETFATEIMGATWRLRRCRVVEADFAERAAIDPIIDPMIDEALAKEQKSVDRARAQSHNILRRSIAELRRMQTERSIRRQLQVFGVPGLTDSTQVINTQKTFDNQRLASRKADGLDTLQGMIDMSAGIGMTKAPDTSKAGEMEDPFPENPICEPPAASDPQVGSSFCKPVSATPKTAPTTSRNAICPCGSGTKYKRCCGKGAASALNMAA